MKEGLNQLGELLHNKFCYINNKMDLLSCTHIRLTVQLNNNTVINILIHKNQVMQILYYVTSYYHQYSNTI